MPCVIMLMRIRNHEVKKMKHNWKKLGLALFLGLVMTLCGCGKDPSAMEKGKVFHYGTMAYGPAMQNAGMDPHDSYCGWSTVRYGVGETLFKFDQNMHVEPWVAESYRQLNDHTLEIKIRDNVTFSNGKKVTGEAVKKCFDDLVKRHDRAPHDLKVDHITADGQTVTIYSREKVPALVNYLADPYGAIIDMDAGIKDRIVVGTGPYMAVHVDDKGVELKKNENYWGKVKPKLDRIIVSGIPDGDALSIAMQSGELDAVQGLPYASLKNFQDKDRYKISFSATSRVYQAAMNFRAPVLQDPRIRQAIVMAIDKKQFVDVLLNGNGEPAIGAFPGHTDFGRGLSAPAYDLEGAKKLLAAAGYKEKDADGYVLKDGRPLTIRWLTYTSRQELPLLAEYAQSQLKKIGIKTEVNATDNYKDFLNRGEYDIYAQAMVTAPTGDPEYYFMSKIYSDQPYNNGYYKNAEVDQLINRLHNTFDTKERNQLAIEIQQKILDDSAVLYISFLKMSFVMKKNVSGFTAHPSDYYEITPELDI
jgi:peptide/nickel transport system substrate-binding protein